MIPPCISISASDLAPGDHIEGGGIVVSAQRMRRQIVAQVGRELRILDPEQRISVLLEDHGEEE